jgi:hypothetical protein
MKTLSFTVVLILILLVSISTFGTGKHHTVRKGDTLWDISSYYLHNPFLWPSIYNANKTDIKDPHWIYPGQRFLIPYFILKAKINIREAYKGVTKVEQVVGAAPIVATQLAYKGGYLTDEDIHEGYIVATEWKDREHSVSADTVYIDLGKEDGIKVGDLFTIFRKERTIKHPKTGQNYGQIINILGKLVVIFVDDESSTCEIIQSFDVIKHHDMIMPFEPVHLADYTNLRKPKTEVEGILVAPKIPEKDRTVIPFRIVYIDLGEADGIVPGDYFDIYRIGPKVKDPGPKGSVKLPEVLVGGLQVLTARTDHSTAYVTEIRGHRDIESGELIRLKGKGPGIIKGEEFEIEEEFEEIEEEEVWEEEEWEEEEWEEEEWEEEGEEEEEIIEPE